MPPPAILDLTSIDFGRVIADRDEIGRSNPHRFEFALLDAIVLADRDAMRYVGYHDLRSDAWWARGHIPGRPLFPGVLMIECAAQLASFGIHQIAGPAVFIGLAGVDDVKYRGVVEPGCRFVTVAQGAGIKHRRSRWQCQGFVNNRMVFEAVITGSPLA